MSHLQLLSEFETELRNDIEASAIVRTFTSGEIIMRSGQNVRATMLVASGRVKIFREGADGGEFFMYYLNPGEACALSIMCAVRQETSKVMAQAVEDCEIWMVPFQKVSDWMRLYPSWYRYVVETYRERFEELLETLDQVAFRGLDERLEFYLHKQAKEMGSSNLSITHQQIASDMNSSREVVSRLLKKMEQRGILKLGRNVIQLSLDN
jgi:CRP/FNR family transcriptional regulator, anaerobic regulatory protein